MKNERNTACSSDFLASICFLLAMMMFQVVPINSDHISIDQSSFIGTSRDCRKINVFQIVANFLRPITTFVRAMKVTRPSRPRHLVASGFGKLFNINLLSQVLMKTFSFVLRTSKKSPPLTPQLFSLDRLLLFIRSIIHNLLWLSVVYRSFLQ